MKRAYVIMVDGSVMIAHGVFLDVEMAKEKSNALAREYAEFQASIDNEAYLQSDGKTTIVFVDRGHKTSAKTFLVVEVNLV